jgi:hypothetical protein
MVVKPATCAKRETYPAVAIAIKCKVTPMKMQKGEARSEARGKGQRTRPNLDALARGPKFRFFLPNSSLLPSSLAFLITEPFSQWQRSHWLYDRASALHHDAFNNGVLVPKSHLCSLGNITVRHSPN